MRFARLHSSRFTRIIEVNSLRSYSSYRRLCGKAGTKRCMKFTNKNSRKRCR